MTPRERMLAAISHRPADGFPFCTYNCHPFALSRHATSPSYREVIDAILRTSVGCLCKARAVPASSDPPPVVRESRDGDSTVITATISTPAGPLTSITRKPDGQPAMCVKHLVSGDQDLRRYLSLRHQTPQWDIRPVVELAQAVGEKGLAYVWYADPFSQIADLFDQEDFMMRIADDLEGVARLVEFAAERAYRDLQSLLQSLAKCDAKLLFYTDGPERATPPLLSPSIFAKLVVPHEKSLVELLHSMGRPVSLHCHGRVRAVLASVLECGFDVLEPIEPPPQGDIGLAELLERCDGRLALFGHLQDQDLHLRDQADVRANVRQLADAARGRTGYVCAPTCTPFAFPPSERFVANYLAFLEEANTLA